MQHIHHVGAGVLTKMAELEDSPATCEKYPFTGEQEGEVSLTWGTSGMIYCWVAESQHCYVYPTLDMLLAGGVV